MAKTSIQKLSDANRAGIKNPTGELKDFGAISTNNQALTVDDFQQSQDSLAVKINQVIDEVNQNIEIRSAAGGKGILVHTDPGTGVSTISLKDNSGQYYLGVFDGPDHSVAFADESTIPDPLVTDIIPNGIAHADILNGAHFVLPIAKQKNPGVNPNPIEVLYQGNGNWLFSSLGTRAYATTTELVTERNRITTLGDEVNTNRVGILDNKTLIGSYAADDTNNRLGHNESVIKNLVDTFETLSQEDQSLGHRIDDKIDKTKTGDRTTWNKYLKENAGGTDVEYKSANDIANEITPALWKSLTIATGISPSEFKDLTSERSESGLFSKLEQFRWFLVKKEGVTQPSGVTQPFLTFCTNLDTQNGKAILWVPNYWDERNGRAIINFAWEVDKTRTSAGANGINFTTTKYRDIALSRNSNWSWSGANNDDIVTKGEIVDNIVGAIPDAQWKSKTQRLIGTSGIFRGTYDTVQDADNTLSTKEVGDIIHIGTQSPFDVKIWEDRGSGLNWQPAGTASGNIQATFNDGSSVHTQAGAAYDKTESDNKYALKTIFENEGILDYDNGEGIISLRDNANNANLAPINKRMGQRLIDVSIPIETKIKLHNNKNQKELYDLGEVGDTIKIAIDSYNGIDILHVFSKNATQMVCNVERTYAGYTPILSKTIIRRNVNSDYYYTSGINTHNHEESIALQKDIAPLAKKDWSNVTNATIKTKGSAAGLALKTGQDMTKIDGTSLDANKKYVFGTDNQGHSSLEELNVGTIHTTDVPVKETETLTQVFNLDGTNSTETFGLNVPSGYTMGKIVYIGGRYVANQNGYGQWGGGFVEVNDNGNNGAIAQSNHNINIPWRLQSNNLDIGDNGSMKQYYSKISVTYTVEKTTTIKSINAPTVGVVVTDIYKDLSSYDFTDKTKNDIYNKFHSDPIGQRYILKNVNVFSSNSEAVNNIKPEPHSYKSMVAVKEDPETGHDVQITCRGDGDFIVISGSNGGSSRLIYSTGAALRQQSILTKSDMGTYAFDKGSYFTQNSDKLTKNEAATNQQPAFIGKEYHGTQWYGWGAFGAQAYGQDASGIQFYGQGATGDQFYGRDANGSQYYGSGANGKVEMNFSENGNANKIAFKQNVSDSNKMYIYVDGNPKISFRDLAKASSKTMRVTFDDGSSHDYKVGE